MYHYHKKKGARRHLAQVYHIPKNDRAWNDCTFHSRLLSGCSVGCGLRSLQRPCVKSFGVTAIPYCFTALTPLDGLPAFVATPTGDPYRIHKMTHTKQGIAVQVWYIFCVGVVEASKHRIENVS